MEAELGNYAKAYQLIHSSKIKHDNIYGNRSDIHQELYEIKSRHKQTVIEKDLEIAQKNKELYEKEKKLNRIKTYAMALIAICVVTLLFFINHKQRKKHQLRNAQNEKEIETKNKELTSFALQFIEKEKQVAELCVITSYSIHYTKLYEKSRCANKQFRITIAIRINRSQITYTF